MTTIEKPVRAKQQKIMAEIKEKLENSASVIFADYRGLNVRSMVELRGTMREAGSSVRVYKNTMICRTLEELGITVDSDVVSGPTALIAVREDAATGAKALVEFANDNEAMVIKGGLLAREPFTEQGIRELATLPSKSELIAKVIGAFKAPLDQFVINLSSPLRGLVYVVQAIKDQKKIGGEKDG